MNDKNTLFCLRTISIILKNNNVKLYPVDSEHSAIWQCLVGEKKEQINS